MRGYVRKELDDIYKDAAPALGRVIPKMSASFDWLTPPASSSRRNSSAMASVFCTGGGPHTVSCGRSLFLAADKSTTRR